MGEKEEGLKILQEYLKEDNNDCKIKIITYTLTYRGTFKHETRKI